MFTHVPLCLKGNQRGLNTRDHTLSKGGWVYRGQWQDFPAHLDLFSRPFWDFVFCYLPLNFLLNNYRVSGLGYRACGLDPFSGGWGSSACLCRVCVFSPGHGSSIEFWQVGVFSFWLWWCPRFLVPWGSPQDYEPGVICIRTVKEGQWEWRYG